MSTQYPVAAGDVDILQIQHIPVSVIPSNPSVNDSALTADAVTYTVSIASKDKDADTEIRITYFSSTDLTVTENDGTASGKPYPVTGGAATKGTVLYIPKGHRHAKREIKITLGTSKKTTSLLVIAEHYDVAVATSIIVNEE